MNAAIPDSLREFVASRIAAGGFTSVDEYVEELVEADRERLAGERLEEEISRGIATERVKVTAEDFDRLRREICARHSRTEQTDRP